MPWLISGQVLTSCHILFQRLGISKLKPTKMSIQLADRSIKYPIGVCKNLLVKVGKFIFPVDFVILEMDKDELVLIILGRPFLAMARAVIDVHEGNHNDTINHDGKWTKEDEEEDSNKALAISFYQRTEPVEPLEWKAPDNRLKPSSVEPPKLELKELPEHLEYTFLQEDNQILVVILSTLSTDKKTRLLEVLRNHKGAIAWSIADIKGINSSFCTHKILMEDEFKPSVQPQRRVNPNNKEVVKQEVIKLLDAGLIYPISDSPWVSPVQVVQKKGGMTVVKNEKDELILQLTIIGWCVCIDYHGFSGYFQIPIAPEDQEKTTFTRPYGTLAYKRMPFGLWNAPTTFQRCMTTIFHELIEDSMEVFMDNFSVFGSSFDHCLKNLEKMLKRCAETNLVLNWEICHFMVKEGIILGHKVSEFDIEIHDKKGAKNLVADHLSQLENLDLGKLTRAEIRDLFPEERLMAIFDKNNEPCVLTESYEDAWPKMKQHKFFNNVTADHPGDIMASPPPQGRSSRL
ncbi:DNA-directed DNA polymerase, partial [Tanacetum coccineum]